MPDIPIQVLLLESDSNQAILIEKILASGAGDFCIEWVTSLTEAQKCMKNKNIKVALLDLAILRRLGVKHLNQIFRHANDVLFVVMIATADHMLIKETFKLGAHDCLDKQHLDDYWWPRTLRNMLACHGARILLKKSDARFRAICDSSPLGIFVSDTDNSCVYTNAAYHKISGLSFQKTLGTNWRDAVHPDDRYWVLKKWHEAALTKTPFEAEFRFLQEDEALFWSRVHSAPMGTGPDFLGYVLTVEDITARKAHEQRLKAVEEALFEEKERAQVTLNSIGDAVMTTDLQNCVTYLNQVAEQMTGWSSAEAAGKPLAEIFRIVNSHTGEVAPDPAKRAIMENLTVGLASDSILIHRDGTEVPIEDSAAPIHDRHGGVLGAVIVFHDVTHSRAMALRMSHLAQHDFLTGLPNRLLLEDRASQAISYAGRHQKRVAVMFLDLDHFKNINDSLGHAVGDKILISIARRLGTCIRNTDTVCRQGGDEFVILLAEIDHPMDASFIAEKLLTALSESHYINETELQISPSIGISVFPEDGTDVETLLQNADTAMYHAKANGRARYQFFTSEMNVKVVQRMQIEVRLRRGIREGEFLLHYQPKIDLRTGAMCGIEALIRWQDPELGLLYPNHFIAIAEDSGLIVPLGRWVMQEVCQQVQVWLGLGLKVVPVAVNISSVEFRHKGFLDGIATILKKTGIAARYLQMELTESVLMHEVEASSCVLRSIKAMGIKLAIDDFGTGYSSLSYLKRFPIDTLKIDQSFIHDIATDPDDATIVSAVINMGRNLNQRVIAEGIETQEQLDFLQARDCDEGQGFWFDYPLSVENLTRLLAPNSMA